MMAARACQLKVQPMQWKCNRLHCDAPSVALTNW
jgi:hypothetical protein